MIYWDISSPVNASLSVKSKFWEEIGSCAVSTGSERNRNLCKRFRCIYVTIKGARSRYFRRFCLILSIMSSKRQIGRARVFHLQNKGDITTENDFPAA